jgi:hypothetical protein
MEAGEVSAIAEGHILIYEEPTKALDSTPKPSSACSWMR